MSPSLSSDMVGAVLAGDRELLRAARRGDHRGTQRLAALDRGQADAAARAMHEKRLAGMEVGAPAQGAMGGAVGDGEAGRGDVVHVVGQEDDVVGPGDGLLGEGAMVDDGQHALARLEPAHAGADGLDLAGELQPGREGQRRLFLVAAP